MYYKEIALASNHDKKHINTSHTTIDKTVVEQPPIFDSLCLILLC